MDIKESLKSAGLTENEISIYLALLEVGPTSAGVISKKIGIHRRVAYDVIDRLIKKGLIGYITENGKKVFSAVNPKRLEEIMKEKQENISMTVPSLLEIFNSEKAKKKEKTLFFSGKEGLMSVFEDQLNEGKELLIIGASPKAYEIFPFYFKWFDKARIEKKIKAKIIFDKKDKPRKIAFSEVRQLPQKYSSSLGINIYGKKVAIILWDKEKPFAVLIENAKLAEGYKKQFEMMWRMSKEYK
jgi:HTH-type transcriptional regulator, sugar sensing transcriptional regulator